MRPKSLSVPVGSYPAFSLSPRPRRGYLFSVALSVGAFRATFPLGSTMLCVARTFLPVGTERQAGLPDKDTELVSNGLLVLHGRPGGRGISFQKPPSKAK